MGAHVARMGRRGMHTKFANAEDKRPIGRPMYRWKCYLK